MRIKVMGAQRAVRSMGEVRKWANVEIDGLTFESAEKGRRFAYKIAPEFKGGLKEAIQTTKSSRGGFRVVSKTPKRNNPRDAPYHIFLHYNKRGGYQGNKKSGDHQYMFTTFEWLSKTYPDDIGKELDKVLKS